MTAAQMEHGTERSEVDPKDAALEAQDAPEAPGEGLRVETHWWDFFRVPHA